MRDLKQDEQDECEWEKKEGRTPVGIYNTGYRSVSLRSEVKDTMQTENDDFVSA
jgi:hypothetical protein